MCNVGTSQAMPGRVIEFTTFVCVTTHETGVTEFGYGGINQHPSHARGFVTRFRRVLVREVRFFQETKNMFSMSRRTNLEKLFLRFVSCATLFVETLFVPRIESALPLHALGVAHGIM